jgi:endonuclease/exonuclease/phosphatase (EEP) superfamily protein YafD
MSAVSKSDRRRAIPSSVSIVLGSMVVLALPFVAHRADPSADQFTAHHFAVWPGVGWVVCALLTAVVITRQMQIDIAMEEGAGLAVAYDALPLLLVAAWLIAVVALATGHWLLAVAAGGLCAFHLVLVVPRLVTERLPVWARRAPRLRVAVANVFIDNQTPAEASVQLVQAGVDVLVLVESTSGFMSIFDENGGDTAYPHRVADPDDDSDYAVAIVSKLPLGPRSEFRRLGSLRLAIADVEIGGTSTLIEVLKTFVPTLEGPVMIAGDLNTTRYRPEFEQILALGYSDAIDSLGKGLNPSFKLSSDGGLSALGAVVRLDHALVNADMHAISLHNLKACGSDHLPFVIDVAVRTTHDGDRNPRRGRRAEQRLLTGTN